MRLVRWSALAFLVLFVVGCNNTPADPVPSNTTGIEVVQQPDSRVVAAKAPEVQVDIKSWEEIGDWVARQRGKVVVVDVWSNW